MPTPPTQREHTLLRVLEALLRALHPIIPFITEESGTRLRRKLGVAGNSIIARAVSAVRENFQPPRMRKPARRVDWLREVLTQVRRIRSEMNIAPGKPIPLLFAGGSDDDHGRTEKFAAQIEFLARTESQRWLEPGEAEPAAAAAIVGEMKLLIPLAGLIDAGAEKARLEQEIKRLQAKSPSATASSATPTSCRTHLPRWSSRNASAGRISAPSWMACAASSKACPRCEATSEPRALAR